MKSPISTDGVRKAQRWALALLATVCILGAVYLMLAKGVKSVRRDVRRMNVQSNLKYLGFAMRHYAEAEGGLPPTAVRGRDEKPLLSWRVLLLPFIEGTNLHAQFKLDEPWDSEHNRKLIPRMPRCYEPYSDNDFPPNMTFFQVIRGPGTPFERPRLKLQDLKGVASKTFLIVEAAEPVIWTKPDDIEYHPDGSLPRLGGIMRDGSFRIAWADGSVSQLTLSDEHAIRAGITGTAP